MKKQRIKKNLIAVAFATATIFSYAQTPYDSFAPSDERKPMLTIQNESFIIPNNNKNSEISYAEFNIDNAVLNMYNNNDSIVKKVFLTYMDKKWWVVDPRAEKYPNMSPYNYCANNPIIYIDPNGDTIAWHNSLASADIQSMQSNINNLTAGSQSFNQLYQTLQNSTTVYTINIGQTQGGVPGQFNPKDNTITFLSANDVSNTSTTLEEFFHAFQFDMKSSLYPDVANSNIEFEAKLYKVLVSQEMSPDGMALPNPETGMQYVTDAMVWANTPLTAGSNSNFPEPNFSTTNLSSSDFNTKFYQPALNNFVNTWRAIPNAPRTYTATPSIHSPAGIIYLQNKLGR